MRLFFIAWECSLWNCIMVSLNRKATFLWKPKHCYIDLCQGYYLSIIMSGSEYEKLNCLVQGDEGTRSGRRKSAGQVLLWHRGCHELMLCVVLTGWKDRMTLKWFFLCKTYRLAQIGFPSLTVSHTRTEREREKRTDLECVSVSGFGPFGAGLTDRCVGRHFCILTR